MPFGDRTVVDAWLALRVMIDTPKKVRRARVISGAAPAACWHDFSVSCSEASCSLLQVSKSMLVVAHPMAV